ncbi:MAG TPA: preprotein translocase subunit SecE [Candidatus Woesebacteria bacterium]|nr:preprotein translocase subunit SecE [Candidatus Woesebacteria bacterium]HRS22774.1 preprotein translocase subunit SecE [Candidatus Woesebacteria bacterium]HRT40344.1 preprotein translocase subunit SecE [Candidatus Woesebacteria bacterium]
MQRIIQFIKEVIAEFRHISWPSKEALIQLTSVVIFISIVISLILGGFDYLFTRSFASLGKYKKQPVQELIQPTPVPTSVMMN